MLVDLVRVPQIIGTAGTVGRYGATAVESLTTGLVLEIRSRPREVAACCGIVGLADLSARDHVDNNGDTRQLVGRQLLASTSKDPLERLVSVGGTGEYGSNLLPEALVVDAEDERVFDPRKRLQDLLDLFWVDLLPCSVDAR